MNTKMLIIVRFVLKLTPTSRLFQFKSILFNLAGAKVSKAARIYSNVKVYGDGNLEIGQDTFIGHEVMILTSHPGSVKIGNNVDIAPRVYLGTGSHLIDHKSNHVAGKGINNDIVWIGACSIILPGVIIGEKSVIGAGSLVNCDIPPYSIAVGVPCKPIKKLNKDKQEWEIIEYIKD